MRYIVNCIIQSRSGKDAPVSVQWYAGTSHTRALAAMVQAAAQGTDGDDTVPESVRYSILSVSMIVERGEDQ